MQWVIEEIQRIQRDIPKFVFSFPDMNKIRRLSTEEYARRVLEKRKTTQLVELLLQRDPGVLRNLPEDQKQLLREKLRL